MITPAQTPPPVSRQSEWSRRWRQKHPARYRAMVARSVKRQREHRSDLAAGIVARIERLRAMSPAEFDAEVQVRTAYNLTLGMEFASALAEAKQTLGQFRRSDLLYRTWRMTLARASGSGQAVTPC